MSGCSMCGDSMSGGGSKKKSGKYENRSTKDLKQLASKLDVKGRSKLTTKSSLIKAIRAKRTGKK